MPVKYKLLNRLCGHAIILTKSVSVVLCFCDMKEKLVFPFCNSSYIADVCVGESSRASGLCVDREG